MGLRGAWGLMRGAIYCDATRHGEGGSDGNDYAEKLPGLAQMQKTRYPPGWSETYWILKAMLFIYGVTVGLQARRANTTKWMVRTGLRV